MVRETKQLEIEGAQGGKGKVLRREIVSKDELNGHGRLYAHNILPSGSSVGWHQHVNDTEPYYILSGEGDFYEGTSQDGERIKTHVKAGDICTIPVGGWHSLENNSNGELEVIALIYNKKDYLL